MLLLFVAIVEGVALLLGGTLSEWLESALPDPWDGVDGPFDKALGWLHLGRVPVLVLIVLFLTGFAITGFALNMVVHRILGFWVPPVVAVPLALITALPFVRILGGGLARVMPQDQTYAVTLDTLVGRVATIISGTARHGYPAQGKVVNQHGQTLYIMVEPDQEDAQFESGASVLLVRQLSGTRFSAIPNPRPDLL